MPFGSSCTIQFSYGQYFLFYPNGSLVPGSIFPSMSSFFLRRG
ncbi:hypothetical protein SBA4_190042 [Candidatus Sulfopaludibacter sp. SbA4]|nr:hypothetical protein SBA4_190042 [Candidatus Sulfopaludibacter sp. SbA4]